MKSKKLPPVATSVFRLVPQVVLKLWDSRAFLICGLGPKCPIGFLSWADILDPPSDLMSGFPKESP